MAHDEEPPSERNGAATATGRHRAITSPDDWSTQKRAIERARREDAKLRGNLEARIAQLVHDARAREKLCDANTTQLTLHAHRLGELEADMKKLPEATEFIAGVNGVLATLKWAIPVLIAATSALASGITYLLVHR